MLTIVPTPIGNLKDITLRALAAFQQCDGIICEDSRRASILLNHYAIQRPLIVLNDYNEASMVPKIIEKMKKNEHLVLISDAGTPLVSDPGYKLVREALAENIPVDSLPGPSSVITALTLSGLPPDKFLFLGYLPDKTGHRQKTYQQIKDMSQIVSVTCIIFVAPFKLVKSLEELSDFFGDISVTLAKELTKIHQSVQTQSISAWLTDFTKKPPKGEWILLLRL